jgi:oligopeptide/dipeptide ABC transporter ATP-binding protein
VNGLLLSLESLSKHYEIPWKGKGSSVRALDEVSLEVAAGEVLGVVGESGSGKSTLARLILRSVDPSSGKIWLDGTEISKLSQTELRIHRRKMQMVFQDPFRSLNPRMSAEATIAYPLMANGMPRGRRLRDRTDELLSLVGLSPSLAGRFPHQLSGGQRQRVGIARAIALDPKLLVADEPTSSLDLSTQAQILNLFGNLRQRLGMACVFITHDLGVAQYLSDRIAVLYAGRVVELSTRDELFQQPRHPYTQALLSAAVLGSWNTVQETVLEGDPPDPVHLPQGCRFHPRCPYAREVCVSEEPALRPVTAQGFAACHREDPAFARLFFSPDGQPLGRSVGAIA